MSVFNEKRIYEKKQNHVRGIVTAGQVSANDIILWSVFLMPVHIALFGAGQCIVSIGLFAGNVFMWLFLSKRMNSYAAFSNKRIYNASEFFAARYDSISLKNLSSFIWIAALGAILVSVMKTVVEITSEILDINRYLCLFVFLILLVLATILLDSGIIGICKTIILAAVITVAVATIVYVFSVYHASELLDLYRKSNIPTDTSRYLNILYYKGKLVEVTDVISMLAVGIGCIGMPLMYKGVINIRDVKRLDRSGICAVVFEGLAILSTSIVALLVAPVIHPAQLEKIENSFDFYNMLYQSLLSGEEYAQPVRIGILLIYLLAVIILMESLMRTVSEHVRGLIPSFHKTVSDNVKMIINSSVIVLVGIAVFICVGCLEFNSLEVIIVGWGICAGALAAPCIMALMWKGVTKTGMLRGMETGLLVYLIWKFVPMINNMTMYEATGVCADLVAFLFSLAAIIILSMFTQKTNEEEQKVFEQMRQSQR